VEVKLEFGVGGLYWDNSWSERMSQSLLQNRTKIWGSN
jgi:hypothetical protein